MLREGGGSTGGWGRGWLQPIFRRSWWQFGQASGQVPGHCLLLWLARLGDWQGLCCQGSPGGEEAVEAVASTRVPQALSKPPPLRGAVLLCFMAKRLSTSQGSGQCPFLGHLAVPHFACAWSHWT